MLTDNIMYRALLEKDASFEGLFIVAVKTTGIFCRPTCSARKPKKENVIFYRNPREALTHGFRPCKICTPLEMPAMTPDYIKKLIREINLEPSKKIKDYDLRVRGLEPNKVRRWFRKNHNMTFQTFQRMMRINSAFNLMQTGEKVTGTAFDSGYESVSGFNSSFRNIFNETPSKSRAMSVINIKRIDTPLGPMYACATVKGICLFDFTDRRMLETEFKELKKYFNAVILPGENRHFASLEKEASEYFGGKRKAFTVPLDTPGTDFQKSVWEILKSIPYGTTLSYKQQSSRLGKPSAVRAVANANGHNRVSIIIPCHRVIGEDGTLTGYGGGLWRKKWLIDFEKENK